jgi:dienelactone hydrolase
MPAGARAGWVDQFPGNLMWSNAVLVCKGMAPYGVVALADIDAVAAELDTAETTAEAWWRAWSRLGEASIARAERADRDGDTRAAGLFSLRAGYYLYTGERFTPPGAVKRARCEAAFAAYGKGFRLLYPGIGRVEIASPDGDLPALFVPARADSAARAPAVVVFNGMDNCKEMSALFLGLELAARGMHVLAVDGPGQGEARRLRDIPARHDYEVPAAAAFDHLAGRADVDPARIAVVGYSFGGYYAARIAARAQHFAAAVAMTAGHWDLQAFQASVLERAAGSTTATAQSNFQFRWVVGAEDDAAALALAGRFAVRDIAGEIGIPFLITHGAEDRIIPVANAQRLYDAIPEGVPKALHILSKDDGGCQHAHVDDRQAGVNRVARWLETTLHAARPKGRPA